MKTVTINAEFKGSRNYIHGTTMFSEIIRIVSEKYSAKIIDVNFMIHKMTNRRLLINMYENENLIENNKNEIAHFSGKINNSKIYASFIERDGFPEKRVTYDEDAIIKNCKIVSKNKSIQVTNDIEGYSDIEILVSMNKALHLEILELPINTQWVFCRLDCPIWPLWNSINGVNITLMQTLGTKLTCSDIEINNKKVGKIYFSAKSKP